MLKGIKTKKFNKRFWVLTAIIAIFIVFCVFALDERIKIRNYTIDVAEIEENIRIALVSDLHSDKYGKNQKKLIKKLEKHNPDIILLAGDIFDAYAEDTNAEIFIKAIADKYPCYYVTGNHEWLCSDEAFLKRMAMLEDSGVVILKNETRILDINGQKINLCGVDDTESFSHEDGEANMSFSEQIKKVSDETRKDNYTILLSHRPERFETYAQYDFDLVVSGHAHGGQIRIPAIINGVYAPNQGLFPEYAGGQYDKNGITMIVSRGLAKNTTWVPRVFNRPEIVIIDLM